MGKVARRRYLGKQAPPCIGLHLGLGPYPMTFVKDLCLWCNVCILRLWADLRAPSFADVSIADRVRLTELEIPVMIVALL